MTSLRSLLGDQLVQGQLSHCLLELGILILKLLQALDLRQLHAIGNKTPMELIKNHRANQLPGGLKRREDPRQAGPAFGASTVSLTRETQSLEALGGAVFDRDDLRPDLDAKGSGRGLDYRILAMGLILLMVSAILVFL